MDEIRSTKGFRELSSKIGFDAAITICREFGGQRKYIPKFVTGIRAKRDSLIHEQYMLLHYSTKKLSYRWGLSQRRIQQILKKQAALTTQRCS